MEGVNVKNILQSGSFDHRNHMTKTIKPKPCQNPSLSSCFWTEYWNVNINIMPFCNKLSTIWKQCKYRLYRSTNLHVRSIADVYSEKSEFHWLSNCSPSFIIDGDKVHVLTEPCQFYETLKVLQTLLMRHIYVLQYKP